MPHTTEKTTGVIFDCDGTLVDTMPLHFRAWQIALEGGPLHLPEDLFYELGGVPSPDIIRELNRRHGADLDPVATAAHKETIYIQILPEAQPIECAIELVHEYHGKYPIAVASGGTRPIITRTLQALGILDLFDAVATCEDVRTGKPAPDLFLYAAERMAVDPAGCIVYEDSPLGLEAALRAGMTGIDIRTLIKPSR